MSTMIKDKDTGTWVTVAGGHRMWVGTKADGNIGASTSSVQVYGSFTYRTKDWYNGD